MTLRIQRKTEKGRNALVYVDDHCVGTLPVKVLPPYVIEGRELKAQPWQIDELLNLIKNQARDTLLDYLAKAEHSEWQSRELLKRHRFGDILIDELIAYCKEHSFIDDARFAEIYIRSWLNRGTGKRLLISKLYEQRIAPAIWQPILAELYDRDEAQDSLASQMRAYISRQKDISSQKLKDKVFSHFIRKGFDLDQIAQAWTRREE
ncbi:MAG: RecX family transcriptional regulator [Candidatus Cloacimonetes bacterium]|nr:RecX family transcriptional regulator [Candidatus Cloacimonadota bacterium]